MTTPAPTTAVATTPANPTETSPRLAQGGRGDPAAPPRPGTRIDERRSARKEREPDPAVGVVAVEIDEHEALPGAEGHPAADDGDHE